MSNQPMSWPHDADGNPMAIVVGSVTDTIKVRENWVKLGHDIMRPVPNGDDEQLINHAREVQQMAEFVVGSERFLLNQELAGVVLPVNPVTGERFAQAPKGYDPSSMKPHPGGDGTTKTDEGAKS